MLRVAVPLLIWLVAGATQGAALGAELQVASAAAMQAALQAALPDYQGGTVVHAVFGTAGEIRNRVADDAPLDIVILPPERLKQLAAEGRVVLDTAVPLGATEIGVALRDGAPRVTTDTVEALHAALFSAASIGIADPSVGATTGVHLSAMLKSSGWGTALGARVRVYPDGGKAMQALAHGEVGVAMGQLSEMRPVPGIYETGLVPPSWQLRTVYAGAVTTRARDPAAARALLAWLASAQVTPYFEKVGLDRP
jgi:molybdate transport system substrate-binding protein